MGCILIKGLITPLNKVFGSCKTNPDPILPLKFLLEATPQQRPLVNKGSGSLRRRDHIIKLQDRGRTPLDFRTQRKANGKL